MSWTFSRRNTEVQALFSAKSSLNIFPQKYSVAKNGGGELISKMGSLVGQADGGERAKKSKVITSVINLVPMKVMDWKQTDLFLLILLWLWQEFRRVMNLLFYRTSSLLEYVHHSSKCLLHKGVVTFFHRKWQLWMELFPGSD